MRGFRELEREFPKAYSLVQIKLRKVTGIKVDIDGPLDELVGDLLSRVADAGCNGYGDRERDAMRACLEVLDPNRRKEFPQMRKDEVNILEEIVNLNDRGIPSLQTSRDFLRPAAERLVKSGHLETETCAKNDTMGRPLEPARPAVGYKLTGLGRKWLEQYNGVAEQ